jgi:hypothetical protein
MSAGGHPRPVVVSTGSLTGLRDRVLAHAFPDIDSGSKPAPKIGTFSQYLPSTSVRNSNGK